MSSKLRLDYVSPLPPVRSGISDYSLDLLPHLETRCDLRVLSLPGSAVEAAVESRWHPQPAREALTAGSRQGRLPLYQMGNNLHHEVVEELASQFPGVLTLHDLVLHHLLLERSLGRGELDPYRDRLVADHGALGHAVAMARRWGAYSDAALFALPAHRELLLRQRGVLVHSRWAADFLQEEEPALAVRVVPMGVPLPAPADSAAGAELRLRYGVPSGSAVLGSFGFQTPIKRTEKAVEMLACSGLEKVHLLIVGQVSEQCDLLEQARRFGVEDRVHVMGFVPYEDFEAAIAATDLCLNLRYPTAGETSASLLRVLAVGRPAVVSDYAQFAELPERAVVKVPLGSREVPALAAAVRELLENPEALRRMGEEARDFVGEAHDPARAAQAAVDACHELGSLDPPLASGAANFVPSTLSWGEVRGRLEVAGAEGAWLPGERRRLRLLASNQGRCRWLPGRSGAGGVAFQIRFLQADGTFLEDRPWIPLPRQLAPGESCAVEFSIRRPAKGTALRVEGHVLGGAGFAAWGGPVGQVDL